MSFTPADLDAINTAIATGELTVNVDGRSITYRSMDDLMKARALIEREINRSANRTGPRHILADFSDG